MADFLDVLKDVLFHNRSRHAIPVLDGPLTPNHRIAQGQALSADGGLIAPDDVLLGFQRELYVSSEDRVLRLTGHGWSEASLLTTLPGAAGALALDEDGSLYVCVDGTSVHRVRADGTTEPVTGDLDLRSATSITVADNRLFITEGSREHSLDDWAVDWARRESAGLLHVVDLTTGTPEVLLSQLRYPAGVCVSHDGSWLLYTESWAHRVCRIPVGGPAAGAQVLMPNLPGYPARIRRDPRGGYWVAVLGLRTHLLDFVVTQDRYMREMVRTVDPEYWIRPRLRPVTNLPFLAPLQGGGIVVLGRRRYSAPPQTYGLAIRIDDDGQILESVHDQEGGAYPGVVSVDAASDELVLASKGGDAVVALPIGTEAGPTARVDHRVPRTAHGNGELP